MNNTDKSVDNIKVIFAGDVAPCRRYEDLFVHRGERVLNDILPLIESADISFVNLECPITTHVDPIEKSGPALKAVPETINAIRSFTVAGLANNHILDYGSVGLEDTIAACKGVGIATVGAGSTLKEAQQIFIQKVKGVAVAIIAIAEYEFNQSENGGPGSAPIDIIDNTKQIQEAKALADIVIVTIHGGNEYFPYPRPGLRKLCRYFIELGVDAVICHHPHIPGAYEVYNDKPIYYSIGNFLFDNDNPPNEWDMGYLVELEIDLKGKYLASYQIHPYRQSISNGGVRLLMSGEKEDFIKKIESYRYIIEKEESYLNEWDRFVKLKSTNYLLRQYNPIVIRGVGFLVRRFKFLERFLFNRNVRGYDRLNIIRCQSHQEVFIDVLKKKLELF